MKGPALKIESVGIQRAIRPLHLRLESPALTWNDLGNILRISPSRLPTQIDLLWKRIYLLLS
jgi:hypothetical protein